MVSRLSGRCQPFQIVRVDMQFALLAEACFECGSEQFVSSLAFCLQSLRLNRRFLLLEILFVDGIVLGDTIDHPIRSQRDWISHLADRKFERNGELLRASDLRDRPGPRERLARFHIEAESLRSGCEVLARLRAFAEFLGASLGEFQRLLTPEVSQYPVANLGQRRRVRWLNILNGENNVSAVGAERSAQIAGAQAENIVEDGGRVP